MGHVLVGSSPIQRHEFVASRNIAGGVECVRGNRTDRALILNAALSLSADQRAGLVKDIWDSLVQRPEQIALSPAQERELDRCWQAYQSQPKAGKPWSAMRRKLENPS